MPHTSADQMPPRAGDMSERHPLRTDLAKAALVALMALVSAWIGIALRPAGDLSAFWPANALLMGMMIRWPGLARPAAWAAAAAGLVAADMLMGNTWLKASVLSAGNLVGVAIGFRLARRMSPRDRLLRRPSALVWVMLIALAASIATAATAAFSNVLLFDKTFGQSFCIWLTTELANYIVILPLVLTFPDPTAARQELHRLFSAPPRLKAAVPLLSYLACMAMAPVVGGPGALAIPVPSLLWCALTYGQAAASVLTLSFAVSTLVFLSISTNGVESLDRADLLSLRLGVMLVALGPITVASVMAERNDLLARARVARKAAEDAMAARTLLLATMAHELRSPLTAVVGFSGLMARQTLGPMGNPKYVDYAQTIEMAGSHLSDLVGDLLDTARVEAGRFELNPTNVASQKIVEQSLRLVRGLAVDGRVELTVLPSAWPEVFADPRAVKQVLINLLSNAVKFSPAGGVVEVGGEVSGERLVMFVTDTGPGVAPEDAAQLGKPYVQGAGEETNRRGWGLGLMLSGELVAMHGGALRLESRSGGGARAAFDLPLA